MECQTQEPVVHDPLTHDAAGAPGADLFQGILPMMVARAHVPLAPAKVSRALSLTVCHRGR